MRVTVLVLPCFVALASCTSGGITFEFYVVVKPDARGQFIEAITSIARGEGLETAVGQATSDTGNVLSVLEGRGHGLKLWVQNTPLSGREDPTLCGIHHEAYVDPAQFIVSSEPRFFETKSSRAAAVELGEKVRAQLKKAGYDVRREPAVCGAAVLPTHKSRSGDL